MILTADIRELISLDDVMEELGLGPNGGLMYCMEYPSLKYCRFFSPVLLNENFNILFFVPDQICKPLMVISDILKKIWTTG